MHFHQRIAVFGLMAAIVVPAPVTAQRGRRDDTAVYAAVANAMLDSTRTSAVIVRSVTRPSVGSMIHPAWEVVARIEDVDSAMAKDFKSNNMDPRAMPQLSIPGKSVRLTADSVIERLEKSARGGGAEGYWSNFRKQFPGVGGILSFGGIGYSVDGQSAVVDVGYSCGGTCGSGRIIILRKIEGSWSVTKEIVGWRS